MSNGVKVTLNESPATTPAPADVTIVLRVRLVGWGRMVDVRLVARSTPSTVAPTRYTPLRVVVCEPMYEICPSTVEVASTMYWVESDESSAAHAPAPHR